uniref:Universal stress protein n=1 Tax=Desulfomonile tiedjei TaxID=2358 RepID=A0A7C4EV40_9BACT
MFKKILFPTKFGEFSLDILKSIACLKAAGLEEVVLLHVIDTDNLYTEVGWGVVFNLELITQEASKRLDSYAVYLGSQEIKTKIQVAKGRLIPEIMRVAREESVSLIVAGREKRGILGELFVGSTTHGIIRKSEAPVLVVKYHTIKEVEGKVREHFCTDMFRKILYPTDWSACAERAKQYLRPLRQVGASEILVVHVIGNWLAETEYVSDVVRAELEKEAAQNLKALQRELGEWGFMVKTVLLQGGRTYQSIINLASEADASLIVMGSHGRKVVAETLWGSVSQRVVEYGEKPVLVVK